MTVDLTTTNVFLGVIALISVLKAAAVIGLLAAAFVLVRKLSRTVAEIESKHVAPTAARISEILDDVKDVSGTVRNEAHRADAFIHAAASAAKRWVH